MSRTLPTAWILLLGALCVATHSHADPGWPAGELILSWNPDFSFEPCGTHSPESLPDTVDLYLGARVGLSTIDRADLDGTVTITGWKAVADVWGHELLDVELFPAGAVDHDPDPAVFDVTLSTPQTPSPGTPVLLARLRIQRALGGHFSMVGPTGTGTPIWTSNTSTEDCPPPCSRNFRKISEITGALWGWDLYTCGVDVCAAEVDRPLPGAVFRVGNTETLLVSATGQFRVEFSGDDGATWQTLDNGYSTPGFYHWTVPAVVTRTAMIRMCTACVASLCSEPVVFEITDRVGTEAARWGAIKARY